MVSTSFFGENINLPSSDYTNNKAKICYNAESLKVVTAGNTNIHAHAAITNILVTRQKSKDMSRLMSYMSDS